MLSKSPIEDVTTFQPIIDGRQVHVNRVTQSNEDLRHIIDPYPEPDRESLV
jgi:hypothetical protein